MPNVMARRRIDQRKRHFKDVEYERRQHAIDVKAKADGKQQLQIASGKKCKRSAFLLFNLTYLEAAIHKRAGLSHKLHA